jgi:hypothetical protein
MIQVTLEQENQLVDWDYSESNIYRRPLAVNLVCSSAHCF